MGGVGVMFIPRRPFPSIASTMGLDSFTALIHTIQ
jgi:hypothetical protein